VVFSRFAGVWATPIGAMNIAMIRAYRAGWLFLVPERGILRVLNSRFR
jgi:hypothetical protein